MAQHYPIKNSPNKNIQKICQGICNKFEQGISKVRSSLKYQEIHYEDFKESKNDEVFLTLRYLNGETENIEVHFDSQKKKITNIYLVK